MSVKARRKASYPASAHGNRGSARAATSPSRDRPPRHPSPSQTNHHAHPPESNQVIAVPVRFGSSDPLAVILHVDAVHSPDRPGIVEKPKLVIVAFHEDFTRRRRRNETGQPDPIRSSAWGQTDEPRANPLACSKIMGTMVGSFPVRMIRGIIPGNIERRLSGVS